jgi:diaminopimelate decarboxylase
MRSLYYNEDNQLILENIQLAQLCSEYQTPFYLYSTNEIKRNCQLVQKIGSEFNLHPCYALKANYNPVLIQLIHSYGFGADVVSGGELTFALKSGIPAEQIVFAGVGKTSASELPSGSIPISMPRHTPIYPPDCIPINSVLPGKRLSLYFIRLPLIRL